MSLHLQPVPLSPLKVEPFYFVIRQAGLPWSKAVEVVAVVQNELMAETLVIKEKQINPNWHYGVAKLSCEARAVAQPIQIVRMEGA